MRESFNLPTSHPQIYFEADDVIAEFELLDAPPVSGDSPQPHPHISLSQATANLQAAVDKGYAFKAYNPKSRTFNQVSCWLLPDEPKIEEQIFVFFLLFFFFFFKDLIL